jgi:phosphatidylinositol glycan class B
MSWQRTEGETEEGVTKTWWRHRAPRSFLYTALFLATLVRLGIAFTDDGIYWPDEVYQSLEPAHKVVFGYGLTAWEFVEGARNWTLPGLVTALFAVANFLGLHAPAYYLGLTRVVFILMSTATAWGVWALARALGATKWPAALGAAAYALCRVSLYFSHRAMSENASALTVVLGLWLLVESASRRRRALGASFLGAAVLLRLQCGLFCVIALVWQLARRRPRHAAETAGVLVAWGVLFGWFDHLAWSQAPGARFGGWFHSALKYIDFNLVHGGAAAWGVSARDYYVLTLQTALPLLWSWGVVAGLLSLRKDVFVFTSALAFFVAHSLIPHKELRFMLPVLPLFFALAASGLSSLPAGLFKTASLSAYAFAAMVSLGGFRALTFGEIGAYADRPQSSAWDDYGSVNRLMELAGTRPDLCGLRVDAPLAWTGGYSYLHRKVPIYMGIYFPEHRYNYAIVVGGAASPSVATDGALELLRTADTCVSEPGYTWRLP